MFKSKKTALAAIVAATTLAGTPVIMQSCFMDNHDELVDKVNNQDVAGVTVQVNIQTLSKTPGYLNSEIVSRVSLKDHPEVCLDMVTNVKHGPLELVSGKWYESNSALLQKSGHDGCNFLSDLSKDPATASLINQVFENGSPLNVHVVGTVLGSNTATLTSLPIDVSVTGKRSEINAKIGKLDSTVKFNNSLTEISSDLFVNDLALKITKANEERSLAIDSIKSAGTANKDGLAPTSKLWSGHGDFSISGVELINDGAVIQLPVLKAVAEMDVQGGKKFSESVSLQAAGLNVNQVPMGNFELKFDMSDFDVEGLDKLSNTLDQSLHNDTVQPPEEIVNDVKNALAEAKVNFDPVSWSYEEGSFTTSLNIEVVDLSNVDTNAFANPLDAIISSIQSTLNVNIDKSFVTPFAKSYAMSSMLSLPKSHQGADVLASLEVKGKNKLTRIIERAPEAFIDKGDKWNLRLTIDKSGMKLNGKDFDPFALVAASMQK